MNLILVELKVDKHFYIILYSSYKLTCSAYVDRTLVAFMWYKQMCVLSEFIGCVRVLMFACDNTIFITLVFDVDVSRKRR